MNTLEILQELVDFSSLQTKLINASKNYKVSLQTTKRCYLESLNELLHHKGVVSEEQVTKELGRLNSKDYESLWRIFDKKCRNLSKKRISNIDTKIKKIIDRDIKLLEDSLKKFPQQNLEKLDALKRLYRELQDTKIYPEKIIKYRNIFQRNPKTKTFIFSAYEYFDVVTNL